MTCIIYLCLVLFFLTLFLLYMQGKSGSVKFPSVNGGRSSLEPANARAGRSSLEPAAAHEGRSSLVPAGDKKGRGSLAQAGGHDGPSSLVPAGGHDGPSSLPTAAAMEGRGRLKLAGVTLAVYGLIQVLPSLICLVTQAFHGFSVKVGLLFLHFIFQLFFYSGNRVKHCYSFAFYLSLIRKFSMYKIWQ
jgi:hypothetical protein